jgi:exodeoxyribonuclease VII large subunit
LDVVIIGRGGGSGEDLMAFNDERVVRRVAKIRVPVVSAVGHEIDTSLTDYVADRRAATPSEAAELVVPDKLFRVRAMRDQERHLVRAMRSRLLEAHSQLGRLQGALGDPRFYLAEQQQRLDELAVELERNIRAQLRVRRQLSDRLQRRVLSQHPSVVLTRARASLAPLSSRLPSAMHSRLGRHQALLNERRSSLEALSPLAVLGRGYAIVSTADGRVVTDAETLHSKDIVHLRLRRGQVFAEVTKSDPPEVDA